MECHARTINELVLQDAVVKAINQMLGDKSSYQAQLQLNIASVIRASQATSVENIDEKLMTLQQELIQKAQSKEAYDEIADEIFRLRELRQKTYINGLLLLFCKNLEMKVTQLSTEEKQTLKEIFSRSKPAKEHRKLRRRNPKL